jgi:predicted dienelactone hydrolase
MNPGVYVAIGLFMVGVIYHAGSIAARVGALEVSLSETRDEFRELRKDIAELKQLLLGDRA